MIRGLAFISCVNFNTDLHGKQKLISDSLNVVTVKEKRNTFYFVFDLSFKLLFPYLSL